ncbi:flagellar basal body-associated protein FliL [Shewanella sp. 3B26]|jgi:flagellar FliL protein|uniref:Flagellar protein FliL n=1 Tax=Shewanella zhuhaiensis TaxID=2919576 RepID=A0AAJ1BFI7_9GAMM|nr:flagellar basal body-associated protein FliL [Shewanella zhuhaiensis]MCH4293846.1 flagellar basal body-associated protein FliL [Shewanella zhuhaiensis]
MAEEESLQLEETGGKKSKKLLFIIVGVVVVAALGVGGWLFMGSSDPAPAEGEVAAEGQSTEAAEGTNAREAFYVAMPRPFLFNLPGQPRSRLVEIKVQLMVRGADDDVMIKKHIPLIEDALLTTFSSGDVQKLSTQAGKDELRQLALLNVQNTLQPVTGRKVVEKVLFTGFVMQ